jgi:hypothetical protein
MHGEQYALAGAASDPSLDIAAALSVAASDGRPESAIDSNPTAALAASGGGS